MIEEEKVLIDARVEQKTTHCYCDNCKKLIETRTPYINDNGTLLYRTEPGRTDAFEIVRGHHEWGNDSIDSYETLHACSDECLSALFLDYVEKYHKKIPISIF